MYLSALPPLASAWLAEHDFDHLTPHQHQAVTSASSHYNQWLQSARHWYPLTPECMGGEHLVELPLRLVKTFKSL